MAEVEQENNKAWMYQQRDVEYVTVSPNLPAACAGCRWFNSYGSYADAQHPDCRIVDSYPNAIEATGWCNKFEAMPAEPYPQTPMPVVIVDADVTAVVVDGKATGDEEPPEADGEGDAVEAEPETSDVATVDVPTGVRRLVINIAEAAMKALTRRDAEEYTTAFKVIEHPNGSAHWLAVYSNNFKDRDGELFPTKAIDAYIQRVDTGIVPPPELWVWHGGKNVAIGNADWVAREGHFTFAAGQFYGGEAAKVAKAYYAKHAKDTGISHGFTFPESKFDGKHYHEFNTFEISLLPRGAEANWYTSLEGVKAIEMDEKKQQYLEEVFGKEHAARILSDWDKRGKALEELNVEFKDFAGASQGEASKEAVDRASKSVTDLLFDVLENSTQPIEAATQAVKAAKAANSRVDALAAQVAELKALIDQRPRASQSDATLLNTESEAGKALVEKINAQMVERDPFSGLPVIKTP